MSEGETESTNVDIAALLESLTGETTSECVGAEGDADYDTCKEEEEAMDKANFYCAQCELYLNGAEDYAKHMAGKFHKNRVPKTREAVLD